MCSFSEAQVHRHHSYLSVKYRVQGPLWGQLYLRGLNRMGWDFRGILNRYVTYKNLEIMKSGIVSLSCSGSHVSCSLFNYLLGYIKLPLISLQISRVWISGTALNKHNLKFQHFIWMALVVNWEQANRERDCLILIWQGRAEDFIYLVSVTQFAINKCPVQYLRSELTRCYFHLNSTF